MVLAPRGQSVAGVEAELLTADVGLRWLCEHTPATEWCTGPAWTRAAQTAFGDEAMRFVGFRVQRDRGQQTTELDAVCTLTHQLADWRSGSPGRDEIRWPMDALGYHFAPVVHTGLDTDRYDLLRARWLGAVRRLFPNHRFHLQRTAPAWAESLLSSDGGWLRTEAGAPAWRGDVHDNADSLRATLGRKHRKDLDYYYRRIEREDCRWRDYEATDEATLRAAVGAVMTLHRSRLSTKGLSDRQLERSACLDSLGQTFLTELAVHNRPSLRLSLLWQGPHPIGGCLGFAHGTDYVAMVSGQDTVAGHGLDLGRQVLWHQIQAQSARGPLRIDLMGGDLDYKREFGLRADPTVDIECEPSRAAAWRRRAAVRLINTLRGMRSPGRRRAKTNHGAANAPKPENPVT